MKTLFVILIFLVLGFSNCQATEQSSDQENRAIPKSIETTQQLQEQVVKADSPLVSIATEAPTDTNINSEDLTKYQGYTAYGTGMPPFELTYDTDAWSIEPDKQDDSAYWLISKEISDCHLFLREGPREYIRISERQLAGRTWVVSIVGSNYPNYLIYSTVIENYAALFRINLPMNVPNHLREECQLQAEVVLNTFRINSP
jgi:hypothetical protein